jgi:hypothetical protein
MSIGILLTGVGLGLLAFVEPGDSYLVHILPGVVVFGMGLALTVPPLTNTAVSAVPDSQAGVASGVNDEAARVAALIGVAIVGLVFATEFRMSLEKPNPAVDPERARIIQLARDQPSGALQIAMPQRLRALLLPELRSASINAYRGAMGAGVLIALAGALVAFLGIRNPAKPDRLADVPG